MVSTGIYNVTQEINQLEKEANEAIANGTEDAYFMALLADSLFLLNRTEEYHKYADEITKY